MAFPDAPRVNYEITPLDSVICQFRFPTILKIDAETPSAFQEKVRSKFPFYNPKNAVQLPPDIPPQVAAMISRDMAGQNLHEFVSEDGNWVLSLTRDFIALTCKKYDRWENFKSWLKIGTDALVELYEPAFFIRVGLRYSDTIIRSSLGLEDKSWGSLLKPVIGGALSDAEIHDDIQHIAHQLVMKLPLPDSAIQVNHGLNNSPSGESTYIIDADLYISKRTEIAHAVNELDSLNKQSRLFFRWCITDELHNAMRPTIIPAD